MYETQIGKTKSTQDNNIQEEGVSRNTKLRFNLRG